MAVKAVLRMGDPRLLEVSRSVERFDTAELRELLIDMQDTMHALNGAGLAAPQIGVPLRVVIFGMQSNPRYPDAEPVPFTVLVNPVLEAYYRDAPEARRFGAVVHAAGQDQGMAHKLLSGLGVEPLGEAFDAGLFHQALKSKKAPIKQVLLAGEVVVGVGNIYASEALFLAGIRPSLRACKISRPRAARLHAAIRQVLAQAVSQGGSTLRDFSNAMGQAGHFQLSAHVYDRAGLPCLSCETPIRRIVQQQRSTYFCPVCQKP
jgi:DNA-formamidopyrimidine glycosylase